MSIFKTELWNNEDEKSYGGDSLVIDHMSGQAVVGVEFAEEVMNLQLSPSSTVDALKSLLYSQTFVPPNAQQLYTCSHGRLLPMPDGMELSSFPSTSKIEMILQGEDTPTC